MDKIGMRYKSFAMREMFQFGPGEPMWAARGLRYNVGINGKCEILEIAEVDADIPGLCGPDDLARWNMKLDFTDGTMETHGRTLPLLPSHSGHPCVSLLVFSDKQPEYYHYEPDDEEVVPSTNNNFPAGAESDDDVHTEVASSTDSDMPGRISDSSGSGTETSHRHSSDGSFESSSEESEDLEASIFETHDIESER